MGSWQSQPTTGPIPPSTSAPPAAQQQPAASSISTTPQTILSYFSSPSHPSVTHDHLHPTSLEIRLITRYLIHLGIPSELIPRILDQAEYWSTCNRKNTKHIYVNSLNHRGHLPNSGNEGPFSSGQEDEISLSSRTGPGNGLQCLKGKVWYLISSPIGCTKKIKPQTETQIGEGDGSLRKINRDFARTVFEYDMVWISKVVIETLSKDQGWSTNDPSHYGTYEHSYSWFEISLLRDNEEVEGSRHSIQNNVVAGQYFKSHVNTLFRDHPTLKLAKPGDRIVLWARAQYQGWTNSVKEASITVYTSPYPPS